MFTVNAQKSVKECVFSYDLENEIKSHVWGNLNTRAKGKGHSGKYFSRTNKQTPYGLKFNSVIPLAIEGNNFYLHINSWIRTDNTDNTSTLVISVSYRDSSLFWKGINLKKYFKTKDVWTKISDSVLFPASLLKGSDVSVYLWNDGGNGNTDIDDMTIKLLTVKMPSYLIKAPLISKPSDNKTDEIYKNNFYCFEYSKSNGQFNINSKKGKNIVSSVTLFAKYRAIDISKKDSFFINSFQYPIINETANGKNIQFSCVHPVGKTIITFTCKDNSPAIEIKTRTEYNKNIELYRESLIFKFSVDVTEVYRKNRVADISSFQPEYWLDKEGAEMGRKKTASYIYHTPNVSSLQLNTIDNELIVNLDFYKDHPLLHFPLLDSSKNKFEDISVSIYHKNDSRENTFTLYAGKDFGSFPRLMKNPDGFLAAYIWTEHADWTDLRTHKAVYFGSEKINDANLSRGGFVKYKIPVTKSIFYYNPDKTNNAQSSKKTIFNTPIATLQETTGFREFNDQLYKLGYDLCLHTPEQFSSNRDIMGKALSFMQTNYHSECWIDHGYDNGIKNNREDLVCDGLNSASPFYSKDLWEKYGIKYLWNSYFEDTDCDSLYSFNSMIAKPYIGFGDMIPKPDYWQHPTRTGSLYSWATSSVLLDVSDLWSYFFNPVKFQDLIKNRDVIINHCYPASTWSDNGFWINNDSNTIVIHPGFDAILKLMRSYSDKGLISLTTVKDMMDYRISMDSVTIEPITVKEFKITNKSSKLIKGISFAIRAKSISVDSQVPAFKKNDDDIIFWFDLPARQSKIIKVK